MKRPIRRFARLGLLGAVVVPAACGASTPAPTTVTPAGTAAPSTSASASSTASASATTGASGKPVACTSVTSNGTFAPPDAATLVTLDQISQAVGFTVTTAMPDTQSALAFHGYESCSYQFTTPAGGASVDISLVVGTNPLDAKSAADEFAATQSRDLPLSARSCTGDCAYKFVALDGVGDAALKSTSSQTEVIVARKGRVYLEVGPGGLKESRMVALANLILGAVV